MSAAQLFLPINLSISGGVKRLPGHTWGGSVLDCVGWTGYAPVEARMECSFGQFGLERKGFGLWGLRGSMFVDPPGIPQGLKAPQFSGRREGQG